MARFIHFYIIRIFRTYFTNSYSHRKASKREYIFPINCNYKYDCNTFGIRPGSYNVLLKIVSYSYLLWQSQIACTKCTQQSVYIKFFCFVSLNRCVDTIVPRSASYHVVCDLSINNACIIKKQKKNGKIENIWWSHSSFGRFSIFIFVIQFVSVFIFQFHHHFHFVHLST